MKHLKTLCLVATLALAAMMLAGAGSVSATVLCKTTTTPCISSYGNGTKIAASLSGSMILEVPGEEEPFPFTTCMKTTIKATVVGAGGATTTVTAPVESLTAETCTGMFSALEKGSLEIHHISGSDNGTVTGLSFALTTQLLFFGSCIYGTATATDVGTLVGGELPILKVSEQVIRRPGSGASCPNEMRWTGEFKITEPAPLYVEPS